MSLEEDKNWRVDDILVEAVIEIGVCVVRDCLRGFPQISFSLVTFTHQNQRVQRVFWFVF